MRAGLFGSLIFVLVTGSLLALAGWGAPGAVGALFANASDHAARHDESLTSAPVLPLRRAADEPPPPPTALAAGADAVTPLTLGVVIRRQPTGGKAHVVRQTITRTSTRMHVAPDRGAEWLFERNAIDPRRVSGQMIDHASRQIVFHSDSDLRNMFGIPGWSHLLTLGVDPTLLAAMRPVPGPRTVDGVRFTRLAAASIGQGLESVWWSSDHLLPAEFVTSDNTGRTFFSVETIRSSADESLLRSPETRFPGYDAIDLADWLEDK